MPYDNNQDWENAKDLFKEVTGKSKPDAGLLKHRSGLSKYLKQLDEFANAPSWKTDLKKYQKTLDSFTKNADDYIKKLDKEISKEKDKSEEKTRKRALKALKSRLEKYKTIYDANLEEKNTIEEGHDILEQLQRRLAKGLKVGVANCTAALKAIKSSPTPAVYNSEMKTGTRSLTTALKGFQQIKDKKAKAALDAGENYQQSEISAFWLQKANGYVTALTSYADGRGADGDKTRVPDDTSREQILAEVKNVGGILKDIVAEFRQLL